MAKGIKKIKWVPKEGGAGVFSKLSVPNKILVIEPDKYAWFDVHEWEVGTTDLDKKKDITWIKQNQSRLIIVSQKTIPYNYLYGVKLTKKLCGVYSYYLEASLSGKTDSRDTGLKVRGHCDAKITKCGWSKTKGKTDLTNQSDDNKGVVYGEPIWLHIETEGLNGTNVVIEVFNEMWKGDYKIRTLYNAEVNDGEINIKIPNTHLWISGITNLQENEEFYVKVKTKSGKYITDGTTNTAFGKYLNIKNKTIIPKNIEKPSNQTLAKVDKADVNATRYEPCKFDLIKIKDVDSEKKPVTITAFEGGKTSLLNKSNPKETLHNTIYFNFDEDTVHESSKQLLSNILQFLLEHPGSSMKLNGYACVIGKQNYNKGLSERRANTVKKFFKDGKLALERITSIGHGEVNATDDKQGRDNIKYKNEEHYKTNRRVDIEFNYYGHAGQAVYETVAPSSGKNITIEVIGYDTKKCFKSTDKHIKGIKVNATQYSAYKEVKDATTITIPVESDLSKFNGAPIQYIWPKWNLVNGAMGNALDSAVLYTANIHSCRWFSDNKNANLLIKAYPDIKWELAFEFVIDASNYKATNMPVGNVYKLHNEKARKAGYQRWLMNKQSKTPITIGVGLSAEFDGGNEKRSFTNEIKTKLEGVAKIVAKSIDILQNAINYAQSAAKATEIPVAFDIRYPKFTFVGKWYLERIDLRPTVNVIGEVNLAFNPLIGASVIIDIIGAAITAASYGTTGNPAAAKLINKFRGGLEQLGGSVVFTATFYGEIYVLLETLKIDSVNGVKANGKSTLGGKMGATIELSMSVEIGKTNGAKFIPIDVSFKAAAKADSYFGGELIFDSDDKGMFVQPVLKFSGVMLSMEIEGEAGWWKGNFKVESKVIAEETLPLEKKYIT